MSRPTRTSRPVFNDPVNDSSFPLEKSQYQLLHLVGRGEFTQSEVWAARCLLNDKTVAARLIDLDLYPLDFDQLRKETAFWSTCQHPNVIQYYGSFLAESILWCLMEYLDGGSVSDILRWGYPKGFSDEVVIATILHGLVTFLSYFHERKQLHRAICPNNVLLNMQGEVKIGDLGSATGMIRAGQRYRACFTVMESPYSAPEGMVEGRGYTEKSDIWSVGITAITMATGQTPFASMKPLEQMQAIISGPSPELPAMGYSSHFRDFVRHCLQRDADKRPSAANLLKHPFMKKAKGPEFIVAAVMVKLPSLPQRFESGRADERPIEKVVKPPLISFDFDFDGKEVPIPEKVAPVVQHIQESPKQIGRFKVTVLNQRVEQQEVTTPVDVVASNVKVLSNEAKTLEDEGLEIAELLRQTQEDIHTLTNRRSKE